MTSQARARLKKTASTSQKVRYGVVGLGHIAQVAMLPAFAHAKKNSELTALISDDPAKLKKLGRRYGVKHLFTRDQFEAALDHIDALYIATPNTDHRGFAEIAARRGIHVLCEKPMAIEEEDCRAMMEAADEGEAKLMIGYRLHFEAANLEAVKIARSGQLGDLKYFNSSFSMQVTDRDNIRLKAAKGGGPLYDIGIYCLNAARYLFRAEPTEVIAMASTADDSRFREVDETVSVMLRFPHDRVASFIASFGASDVSEYELVGTRGKLRLENAYDYAMPMKLTVTVDGKTRTKKYPKRDQFGPELLYFSDCILEDREPEPSAEEGLNDVRIIQALLESIESGSPIHLNRMAKNDEPPTPEQGITRPGIAHPPSPFHATNPTG